MDEAKAKAKEIASFGHRISNDSSTSKVQNELGRLQNQVDSQEEILFILKDRLQPVIQQVPTEQRDGDFDRSMHISTLADRVTRNNELIRTILETLAI